MTPTAATFREPCLRAIATLTSLVAGTEATFDAIQDAALAITGNTVDEYGNDPQGNPKVRLWVNQALNKKLRKEGLIEKVGRGKFTLTYEGAKAAALLTGNSVPLLPPTSDDDADAIEELIGTDDDDTDDDTDEVEPIIQIAPASDDAANEGGVSWSIGKRVNTYNTDTYIRSLAIEQTKCFGDFSARSDVCKNCPLSGACKDSSLVRLSGIATRLRKRDEDALKPAAVAPAVAPQDEDDLDIEDIIDAIESEDEDTGADVEHVMVPAAAKCQMCGDKVERNTKGVWVRNDGMYHPKCYAKK